MGQRQAYAIYNSLNMRFKVRNVSCTAEKY